MSGGEQEVEKMYRMFWSFGQKEIAFSKKYSTSFYWESGVCQKLLGIVGMIEKKTQAKGLFLHAI